ncbi:HDOD domain-containing protein [Pseudoduganella namucuonensis]|uniref:HD-like signal output (HDOD) domain, no enzymatic activity n=1 Tax=Pseudoduganella namucuonensis TaxID=1035707 RepID=A0A1I7ITD9_9BURK|nr:HDOD domain-containing protein [Pseudoduganella namucuonensis]SFU76179.1 HD-like signal output (HDOD) domain, no enzymatic activity [Pseudoduganella namucuonensis]
MEKLRDYAQVVAEARTGQLVFPTSVNAALQLQQALADPDCHVEDAIRRVLAEPMLAARAVALANSAVFSRHGGPTVTSARGAVVRVGYRNLYSLAAAMVVRQFGARIRDPQLRYQAEQLWKHCAHVAALAHLLGRHLTRVDPDTAMFAGIMHEVAGFYLLSRADDVPGLLDDPDQRMGALHEILSRELMIKLQVPEPVAAAIVSLRGGAIAVPPQGLRDTLLLAKRLAPVRSPLRLGDDAVLAGKAAVDAYLQGNTLIDEILFESADDARSMSAALLV